MNPELLGWALLSIGASALLTLLLSVNGGHKSRLRWIIITVLWTISAGISAFVSDVPELKWACVALFVFFLGLVLLLLLYERLVPAETRKRVRERGGGILALAYIFFGGS